MNQKRMIQDFKNTFRSIPRKFKSADVLKILLSEVEEPKYIFKRIYFSLKNCGNMKYEIENMKYEI